MFSRAIFDVFDGGPINTYLQLLNETLPLLFGLQFILSYDKPAMHMIALIHWERYRAA